MFNFFDEIKSRLCIKEDVLSDYNIVNISGRVLYVEGHKGLSVLSPEQVAFKVKRGRVVVEGKEIMLAELSQNTMLLQGKIDRVEIF